MIRHGDAADEGQAKPGVEHLGDIGQEQGHAVAVVDAQAAEHCGGGAAAAVEVGVGDLLAGELHEHLVGAGGDDDGQEFAEGFFPGLTAGVWFQTEDVGHSKQLNRGRLAGALGTGLTLTRRAGKINTSARIRRRAGVAGRVWAAGGGGGVPGRAALTGGAGQ